MQAKNPHFKQIVAAAFQNAPFTNDVGIQLIDLDAGWTETEVLILPKHFQHNGVIHGGVIATLADYTGTAAAGTLVAADEYVLTIEFKINLLRAAQGEKLVCRADVLKAGSSFTVSESVVFSVTGDDKKMVAKAMLTIAVLPIG